MRLILGIIFISLFIHPATGQDTHLDFLLESIVVVRKKNFQLSGMDLLNDTIYVIGDSDKNVYKLVNKDSLQPLFEGTMQMEAIDIIDDSTIYISDEIFNNILKYPAGETVLSANRLNTEQWGNAGIEVIALDLDSNTLYLAKEHSNANIFRFSFADSSLRTLEVNHIRKFEDISDLYIHDNHLYVLERKRRCIRKINLLTQNVTGEFSFRKYVISIHDQDHLYKRSNKYLGYGFAEALLITDDHIYIGFDNNNEEISEWVETTYNVSGIGSYSIIMRFIKPNYF